MDSDQPALLRLDLSRWATTSLTVMFGLQLIRVLLAALVGYLRESVGVSSLNLAPLAIGIFALGFLAGPLRRILGPRLALGVTAGGVALARLWEQIFTSPALDFYMSAAGVALFLMFIPINLSTARAEGKPGTTQFGLAFLFGFSLDTALHVSARTVDLSWQPGLTPILILLVLVVAQLFSLRGSLIQINPQTISETSLRRSLPLIGLGPWIFLQLLVYQNVARVSALTGWETPGAGALVILGNALGIAAAIRLLSSTRRLFPITLEVGAVFVALLIQPEISGPLSAIILLGGHVLSFILVTLVFAHSGEDISQDGLTRSSISSGMGLILFVLLTFLYYAAYDLSVGFRSQILPPLAALLISFFAVLAVRNGNEGETRATPGYGLSLASLALLIAPLMLWIAWRSPSAVSPNANNTNVRVMSYNLHNGFNTAGRLDLESLAQLIEASEADVVALQEVSRGWLIWGSVDMLSWLSQRLGMAYVYGPTGDAQWGNAILSRYPLTNPQVLPLPPDDLLLRRGFIQTQVDIGSGTINLLATHLSHRDDQDLVRQQQVSALLDVWSETPASVILGDLNATPDSGAMQAIAAAGFVNSSTLSSALPFTYSSDEPTREIDYIWVTPDLRLAEFSIPQTTASDHLPVIVSISLP